MTLIDLDSKDVQNYTNKDGLIAISDLRMLALADDYVKVDRALEIIDGYKSNATEPTKLSASTYNILLDQMKHDVFALKGGEKE